VCGCGIIVVMTTTQGTLTAPAQPAYTVLRERDAANYIGMSRAWFRQGRMHGRGPVFVRTGRSIRYLTRDLDAWLDAHRVDTHEAGR
jgi:predicted DNA-binding transcriptional regulator AlpA